MATENTAATMTLADFIAEAEVYQYSKESFELMKECHELELMAMYMETAEYVTETSSLSAELLDTLVMTEAAIFTEGSEFLKKLGEKASNVWGSIQKGFLKVISAIVTAFNSFVKFVTGRREEEVKAINERMEKLIADLKNVEDKNAIATAINGSVKGYSTEPVKGGRFTFVSPASNKYASLSTKLLNELKGIQGVDQQKLAIVLRDYAAINGSDIQVQMPAVTMLSFEIADRIAAVLGQYNMAVSRPNTSATRYNQIRVEMDKINATLKKAGANVKGEDNLPMETVNINKADINAQLTKLKKASDELKSYLASTHENVRSTMNSWETDKDNPTKGAAAAHEKINGSVEHQGQSGFKTQMATGSLARIETAIGELLRLWNTSSAAAISNLSALSSRVGKCTSIMNKMTAAIEAQIPSAAA